MDYRRLAGTDLDLSVITFGTITFVAGPSGGWHRDTEEGKRALHLALDSGVNCIHSSFEYETRWVVRQVMRERRDAKDVHYIIKWPNPDAKFTHYRFEPEYMRKRVEDALCELETERIDVLQYAIRNDTECDPEKSIASFREHRDGVVACYEKLRDEGKVGHMGCFIYNNTFAAEVIDSGVFNFFMAYYNMWDTTMVPSLEKIAEKGLSALAYRPLHGGLLTAKRAERQPAPARRGHWHFQQRSVQRDRLFKEVGLEIGDLTQTAIKFPLSNPAVTTMIMGMNTCEQVKAAMAAADGRYLDRDLPRRLRAAAESLGYAVPCNRSYN